MKPSAFISLLILSLISMQSAAEEIIVAVASNFVQPMKALIEVYEQANDHQVTVVAGSSGKLAAQIQHGAPFQLFFSADQSKPAALVEAGLAVAGSRFTYACGLLVLWSAQEERVRNGELLREGRFDKLAIANPRLAPYGEAAVEVLNNLGLWESTRNKLVQGESIAQTFQFVSTGNAELGLVAAAQVIGVGGSVWHLPGELHEPIRQDVVLLEAGASSAVARQFLQFVRSEQAMSIIQVHGYRTALARISHQMPI